MNLTLETAVSSDESRPEDQVRATLSKPIVVDGMTVVKAGAEATGSVLQAKQAGRVKGLSVRVVPVRSPACRRRDA